MTKKRSNTPTIGVVIVAYNCEDVILGCLESLLASEGCSMRIVIVDNSSPDGTVASIRDWAAGRSRSPSPPEGLELAREPVKKPISLIERLAADAEAFRAGELTDVTILRNAVNTGYAGGVNIGLRSLLASPELNLFWVVNPDVLVTPKAASAFARAARAAPVFGLMGGRLRYLEGSRLIQTDGGRVNRWTGICHSIHLGCDGDATPPPDESTLDYVSGASMVVSRHFIECVGFMVEDYFLYYEEVDWATRRGNLSILYCPEATVYHHGGTAIGSARLTRPASSFSNYFVYRNLMRFVRRFNPTALPIAYTYSAAKIIRLITQGAWRSALGAACGLHGLPPPREVRERLSPEAARLAFR